MPTDPLIGRVVDGKYKIETLVGRGGMGSVYRARQPALRRNVAIKVLDPVRSRDKAFAARFKREAMFASRFEHPNAMRVIDFGHAPDGLLYMAMELLEGRTLLRLMHDDWPLADGRIVSLLSQALAAIAAAHEQGVLHRDVKPENIVVLSTVDDDGAPLEVVKVCDFGLAKVLERDLEDEDGAHGSTQTATLTRQGAIIGTPEYISPEQILGAPLDGRADIYAVGVMLFQLLTGSLPFDGRTVPDLVRKHVDEVPRRPSELFPEVNRDLEAVCLKAMSKNVQDRYQSAREMRAALRAAVGVAPAGPAATVGAAPQAAGARRRPPLATAQRRGKNLSALKLPKLRGPGSPSLPSIATSPSEVTTKTRKDEEQSEPETEEEGMSAERTVLLIVAAVAFVVAAVLFARYR